MESMGFSTAFLQCRGARASSLVSAEPRGKAAGLRQHFASLSGSSGTPQARSLTGKLVGVFSDSVPLGLSLLVKGL